MPGKTKMSRAQWLRQSKLWLASLGCAVLVVLLVVYSPLAAEGAREGLLICAQVIIPSLFPFFVLSGIFAMLAQRRAEARPAAVQNAGRLRLMQRLFGQPSAAFGTLLIGLLGGYPLGAKSAAQLYERGLVTRRQAQCLLLYCVNAGPAYVVGVVGSALMNSRKAGIIAFVSLTAASLLLGLFTRLISAPAPAGSSSAVPQTPQSQTNSFDHGSNDSAKRPAVPQAPKRVAVPQAPKRPAVPQAPKRSEVPQALGEALIGILNVCGWVVLFSCLCALLRLLPLSAHSAIPALNAFLEVSSGVVQSIRAGMRLPVVCAVLGWGGLSVHCQIYGDLRKIGLRLRWFWATRAIHGALAAAICAQLLRWFPPEAVASAAMGGTNVRLWAISAPAAAALLLFCAFLILDLDLNRKIC